MLLHERRLPSLLLPFNKWPKRGVSTLALLSLRVAQALAQRGYCLPAALLWHLSPRPPPLQTRWSPLDSLSRARVPIPHDVTSLQHGRCDHPLVPGTLSRAFCPPHSDDIVAVIPRTRAPVGGSCPEMWSRVLYTFHFLSFSAHELAVWWWQWEWLPELNLQSRRSARLQSSMSDCFPLSLGVSLPILFLLGPTPLQGPYVGPLDSWPHIFSVSPRPMSNLVGHSLLHSKSPVLSLFTMATSLI